MEIYNASDYTHSIVLYSAYSSSLTEFVLILIPNLMHTYLFNVRNFQVFIYLNPNQPKWVLDNKHITK